VSLIELSSNRALLLLQRRRQAALELGVASLNKIRETGRLSAALSPGVDDSANIRALVQYSLMIPIEFIYPDEVC
jgi:hypothetical protein